MISSKFRRRFSGPLPTRCASMVASPGAGSPPSAENIVAWYTGTYGVLDATDAAPDPYELVKTWNQKHGAYPLTQATAGKRPKYRSFLPPAVYTFDTTSDALGNASIPIDQQSASFFALVDFTTLYSPSGTTTTCTLFELIGGAGTLKWVGTSAAVGFLVWVDGGGTHTTALRIQSGLQLVGVTLSASAVTIWRDDQSEALTALGAGTSTGITLLNLAAGGEAWRGSCAEAIIYNVAVDAGVKAQIDSWAISKGANYPSTATKILVTDGASISTGTGSEDRLSYAAQASRGRIPLYQYGVGGYVYSNMPNKYAVTDSVYDDNKLCILWPNAGLNDLIAHVTEANLNSYRNAYLDRQRDKGWIILENQITPSTLVAGADETTRQAVNADWLASSKRQYAWRTIVLPSTLDDPTDTDYYSGDGVHPNHAGAHEITTAGQSDLADALALSSQVTTLKLDLPLNGDLLDQTIYQRDFEAVNSPTFTTGLNGKQCLVTSASGANYARYTRTNAFSLANLPMTLMLWFKTSSTGFNDPIIANTNFSIAVFFYATTGNVYAQIGGVGGGSCAVQGTSICNDGVWHCAAFVVDSGGISLYVSPEDGDAANLVQEGSTVAWTGTPAIPNVSGRKLCLGSLGAANPSIDANFQSLRIWYEARTLTQLRAEVA